MVLLIFSSSHPKVYWFNMTLQSRKACECLNLFGRDVTSLKSANLSTKQKMRTSNVHSNQVPSQTFPISAHPALETPDHWVMTDQKWCAGPTGDAFNLWKLKIWSHWWVLSWRHVPTISNYNVAFFFSSSVQWWNPSTRNPTNQTRLLPAINRMKLDETITKKNYKS